MDERQATISEDIVLEEREAEDTSARTGTSERGTFGVDFAEQTGQRQTSLTDRKQQMLQNARR